MDLLQEYTFSLLPFDQSENLLTSLQTGVKAAAGDIKILSIGLIQSLFEGAMYSWVFIWTPALQRGLADGDQGKLPFGWIFASFMVCVMIGSVLFGYLSKKFTVEGLARPTYLVGALALLASAVATVIILYLSPPFLFFFFLLQAMDH